MLQYGNESPGGPGDKRICSLVATALSRRRVLGVSPRLGDSWRGSYKMRTIKVPKSAAVIAAVLLLAACSSSPAPAPNAGGAGTAPPPQVASTAPTRDRKSTR